MATPATSNVHNMAHVLMIAARVCLDSVATRAISLIVQVRTILFCMAFLLLLFITLYVTSTSNFRFVGDNVCES